METFDRYVNKMLDGRYHILRVIGVGGMAVVFEAQDIVMNRIVAVKMLKDDISEDKQAVQRFINESQAVSMLSHPNIVKIFDVSVKGSLKYIVMERVDGITLKSYMRKKGALSTEETLSYTEQVLRALEHAHSKGIIHRDIKPQNILLLKNGKVKVTDFGIAKLPDAESTSMDEKAVGTVYYISPEQASSEEIDCRSDLYSTGVLMYEMATGTLPFNGDTPVSVAMMQINETPKPPSEIKPDIPRGLEQIILGAMEKAPERRFQSAEQMLRYVSQLRTNPNFIFKTRDKSESENSGNGFITQMKKINNKKSTRKQSRSMFPVILGVSIAFAIVMITAGISVLDMFLKDQNASKSTDVKIPNAIMQIYDAKTIGKLFDPSLYRVNVEYSYNAAYNENTITEQDPAAGSNRKIRKNQKLDVTLTVSKGTEMLYVPDYSVTDYRTAKLSAEKLGFKCELREVASEAIEVGFVVYTEPSAKTQVAHGSKLIIYYSKGCTVDTVKVPVLTGCTPLEAYSKMNGNFKVGDITYDYSDTVPAGNIVSQSLASGTKAVRGSYINFVLSLGPELPPETQEPVTTPPETTNPPDTTSPSETSEPAVTDSPKPVVPDVVG